MKKILKKVCLIIFALFLAGCNVNEDISSDNTGNRYAERYQMVSLSEAGVIRDNGGLIYLSTIDEGQEKVLCYLPNCEHAAVTPEDEDPECMAALYAGNCRTAYYEGTIYFFVNYSFTEHSIYKMKTDGAGRELLATELPGNADLSPACVFRGDKVYYPVRISKEDANTGSKLDSDYTLAEVDLNDGSYRYVIESNDEQLIQVNFAGDTLYVQRLSGTRPYLLTVDMNTLEERVVNTTDEAPVNLYFAAYDDDSYFYLDSTGCEAGIRNVDKTVEKVLLKWNEGENLGTIKPSNGRMLYQRRYEYDGEPVGTYFMDLATGEVTNITEEAEKYGIVGYDGYYDVFVAYKFYKNEEDDTSYMKWTIWSREKVLGEAKE